jgi:flagellar motor component MotA
MGSISEPPEVLGKLIGGALVGTFLGVFVAYGMVGPIAQVLGTVHEAETKYYQRAYWPTSMGMRPQCASSLRVKYWNPTSVRHSAK